MPTVNANVTAYANAKPQARTLCISAVVSFVAITALFAQPLAAADEEAPAVRVSYARDIQPILADNCLTCHGLDASSRQADLRLDTQQGQLDSGAVVPGQPDKSLLIARIESDDPEMLMPPPSSKRTLTPQQKKLLRDWIEQGAVVEGHWAFQAPTRPSIPDVRQQDWPLNAIDPFVLSRLESMGLQPSPPADRETLIRRLTLDLTGLPPTPQQIDQFLADDRPDAYERLVDRLLASPHFGERLAQVWLDLSRYADTNGYNNDELRVMWRWRDWVIQTFNRNLPYDQFVIEQLAGDLLPQPTLEQRLATGFNRNHVLTTEGGIIPEEYRVEYVADRVQTTCSVLMGLTVQCARCHDHKYDPITQREYFQLFAYFNHAPDQVLGYNNGAPATPFIKAPTREQQRTLVELLRQRETLERQLAQRETQLDAPLTAWESALPADAPERRTAADLRMHLALDESAGSVVSCQVDPKFQATVEGTAQWGAGQVAGALQLSGGSFVNAGQTAAFRRDQAVTLAIWVKPSNDTSMTVWSKMHDAAANRGYDLLLEQGKPVVHLIHHWPDNALKVIGKQAIPTDKWTHLCVTYDGSSRAAGLTIYVDGQRQEVDVASDTLSDSIETDHAMHLGKRGAGLPLEGWLDDFQFYDSMLSHEDVQRLAAGQVDAGLAMALSVPAEERSPAQQARVRTYFFQHVDTVSQQLRQQLADVTARDEQLKAAIPTALVMEDLAERRTTYLLERGQYDHPGEQVEEGVPASLPPIDPSLPRNRLGLAQWLMSAEHPLTSRVAVNRWWAILFGAGLVETEEDFGVQGSLPSHPELLDWLAVEYREPAAGAGSRGLGWDTKALLRMIVTSATYRQDSSVSEELLAHDPANRYLARGPRVRLAAEQIRDSALAASGLLVPRLGGASVKPYQPAGLWEEVSVERREKYEPSEGAGLYRRSLYTFWKRTCPPPGMTIFDAPDREFCVIRRARTNTPLQALALMNDVTYVEAARHVAQRVLRESADDQFRSRLDHAFRLILARRPDTREQQILADVYQSAFQQIVANQAADKLLSVGDSQPDGQLDSAELAAWTTLTNLLMNLDEAVSKP